MRTQPLTLPSAVPTMVDTQFLATPMELSPRVSPSPTLIGMLRGFLARIRRRAGWFVLATVLGLLGVSAAFVLMPRTFFASSKVVIGSDDVLLASPTSPQSPRPVDNAEVESQVQQLHSTELLSGLLDQPAFRALLQAECETLRATPLSQLRARLLPFRSTCAEAATNSTENVERLDAALRVSASGRSRVVEIGYSSVSPQAAAKVPNMLVDAFLARDRARRIEPRDAAVTWLSSEADKLAVELQQGEAAVTEARRSSGILRGREALITAEQLSALSAQLSAAQAERAQLASRLAIQPNAMMVRRSYEEASERVDSLTSDLGRLSQVVNNQNAVEVTVAAMLRAIEAKRAIYVSLSNRASELEVQRRLVGGSAQLMSSALVPTKPAAPNIVRLLGGGILLAAVLGFAVALLRDAADGTVRSGSRLALLTGLPVLGVVPASRLSRRTLRHNRWLDRPSALQDGVRAILGRVLLQRRAPGNITLLASSDGGEGRSFLALALARYAAASGKRVLLVECCLRKPSLGGDLQLAAATGLSEFLRGETRLEETIVATRHERLDVVLAGRLASESLELLSSARLTTMLEEVRPRYDFIFLDGPPVGSRVDACVLARAADEVLYCTSWGNSRPERVVEGLSSILAAGGQVVGLVVNRAKRRLYPLYEADAPFPGGLQVARIAGRE